MIRAIDESELINQYVEESRERIERIESIADEIVCLLRTDGAGGSA